MRIVRFRSEAGPAWGVLEGDVVTRSTRPPGERVVACNY
jgi:hypothetical protein